MTSAPKAGWTRGVLPRYVVPGTSRPQPHGCRTAADRGDIRGSTAPR